MTAIPKEIVSRHTECARFLRAVSPQVERGEYWSDFSKKIDLEMTSDGILNHGANYFPIPLESETPPPLSGRVVPRTEIPLAKQFLPRKRTALTDDYFEFGNARYKLCDRITRHNYYFDRITLETGKISSMLEIGGGAGILSSIFNLEHGCSNVIIDLPEMLLVSSAFLLSLFPDKNILLPNEIGESNSISGYDFALVLANSTDAVRSLSFDLAVNTASLMEMTYPEVTGYFDLINHVLKPGGFFFCSNRMRKQTNFFKYPWDALENTEDVFIERCKTRTLTPKKNQFADRLVQRLGERDSRTSPLKNFLKLLFWGRWAPSALLQAGLPDYHRDKTFGVL